MECKPALLVADSGSTKTDWVLYSPVNGILEVRTSGINPVRDSQDAISIVSEMDGRVVQQLQT